MAMRYVTTAHGAELNAERVMQSWGYIDAVATTGGSDGGIDVRSSKALAQVKFRSSVTGRPDVQRLVGARGSDTTKLLMFFDFRGYSPQAVEYADQMGVGLFTYDQSGTVKPVNQHGRRMMATTAWMKLATFVASRDFLMLVMLFAGLSLSLFLLMLVNNLLDHV